MCSLLLIHLVNIVDQVFIFAGICMIEKAHNHQSPDKNMFLETPKYLCKMFDQTTKIHMYIENFFNSL